VGQQYLNLTARAWRQLRGIWRLPASFDSFMADARTRLRILAAIENAGICLARTSCKGQLHELLCVDTRYTYPTTYACMNPHHFLFSEASVLARKGSSTQRPMDEMEVRPSSPQEDEFVLLSLGARSPYEDY
jgi:hypothetical protein